MLQIILLIASGTAVGGLFHYLNVPGGCMLGAVAGAIIVKLLYAGEVSVPPVLYNAIQIGMGICVGAMFSVELLPTMRAQLPVPRISTAVKSFFLYPL